MHSTHQPGLTQPGPLTDVLWGGRALRTCASALSFPQALPLILLLAFLLAGSTAEAQGFLTPPPAPPQNPITAEKASLGKILFWDEQLSSDGSIACGTCHIPSAGGSDARTGPSTLHPGLDGSFGTPDDSFGSPGVLRASVFGHIEPDAQFGFEPQVTSRYAPSTFTGGYFDSLFWDGRASTKFVDPMTGITVISSGGALETQSLGPILSSVEMADDGRSFDELTARIGAVRPLALASQLPPDTQATLSVHPTYPDLFNQAFGTPEITPLRIAYALATYQRTLVPNQTPWDDFQRGDSTALTQAQLRGMLAFDSSAACAVCHTPPLFANNGFHAVGIRPSAEDPGRFAATGRAQDLGKFKTPSLRNVELRGHWFHNGRPDVTTLRDTVELYASGVGGGGDTLDPLLNGLSIPSQDVDDITEFLRALTDPRVAAETFPFDRPTLRSERAAAARNPEGLGIGEVTGTGGAAPRALILAAPFLGADGFRIGLVSPNGGTFGALRLQLSSLGGLADPIAVRRLGLNVGALPVIASPGGGGHATWQFALTQSPALVGLGLEAQWWVRDVQAVNGVARSERLRFTVE